MPIPPFDHNLVLPPHLGSPINRNDISPYSCTTLELVDRFATSPARVQILTGFLAFRERLHQLGLLNGFQWLDGSFMEDIELKANRAPNDLDVVTFYYGYDYAFQIDLLSKFTEFGDSDLSKLNYYIDHYIVDASHDARITIDLSRYWIQLFSHDRNSVWKGMLRIELNTPADDQAALLKLQNI